MTDAEKELREQLGARKAEVRRLRAKVVILEAELERYRNAAEAIKEMLKEEDETIYH